MTKRTRRKYTEEFKAEAVRLIVEEGYSISQAARTWISTPTCWAAGSES